MAVLLNPFSRVDQWRAEFEPLLADEDVRWWPEVGDPTEIEYVIAWIMPRSALQSFTNLKAVFSLGAGTEQWQKPDMPDVPVVRLADPAMASEMAAYALAWVIRHQRKFSQAEQHQDAGEWIVPPYTQSWEYRVGILGHGTIGARIGQAFQDLGFAVNAWSRSARETPGVTHYAGLDELDAFLGASDAVINVLPSTAATTGLLTAERFAQFVPGSVFVNVGRGTVLDEQALIAALDDGPLDAAVLDVTHPEPPVEGSPLYSHPDVTLTAHLSGATQVRSAAQLVAGNLARLRAGQTVEPILDRSRGY